MAELIDWIKRQPQQVITILAVVIRELVDYYRRPVCRRNLAAAKNQQRTDLERIRSFLTGRTFENRYLDWLIKEHGFLPILPTTLVPVSERHSHELDNLYVALTLTKDQNEKQDITIGGALQKSSKLVILGDPGAGKTTMLRFLAANFCACTPGPSSLS